MSNGAASNSPDTDILNRLKAGENVDAAVAQDRAVFRDSLAQQGVLKAVREELEMLGQSGPSVDVMASLRQVHARIGVQQSPGVGAFEAPSLGVLRATAGEVTSEGTLQAGQAAMRETARATTQATQATTQATTQSVTQAAPQTATRASARLGLRMRAPWSVWAAAACGVFLLLAGWQGGRYQLRSGMSGRASVYTTAHGQRATITLPDGSIAKLNVGSRLVVPDDYAAGNRNVTLSGEALFTVTHHTKKPFTVLAGSSRTQVLGTTFVVRHYEGDSTATVAVQDGKVAVQSVIVTAAQSVEVGPSGIPRVGTADMGQFTFASGVLTLGMMSLEDAIPALNRWYDADIRLGSHTLASQNIKGRFKAGSIAELAEILEWSFNVRVVRDGNTITLYPRS
jgi:transmembrane sensor